jgi:phage major head subunit gpT-like protein
LTRQALINDDLSAFSRLATQFGYAAAQMEGDVVYGILTGNPVMSDGNALFSPAHKNLASPAGIDPNSMTAARQLMAGQKSSDGTVLGLTPMFLICGPSLETAALQFTSSTIVPTAPSGVIPQHFKSLQVVVDPRIADSSWYLAASPNQIDTIEYAYLEAAPEGGPTVDAQTNWDLDGLEFRAREDFGAAAIEWRGLVRTPSAS